MSINDFFGMSAPESKADKKLGERIDLIIDITEGLLVEMEKRGITKLDLAQRLSKSKSYVSQVLDGNRNMTLGTLSDICFEIGVKPHFFIAGTSAGKQMEGVSLNSSSQAGYRRLTVISNNDVEATQTQPENAKLIAV